MNNNLQELFSKVKIEDVMNKEVVSLYEDDDLSVAQVKFINHTISHLVVLNRRGQISGLISQKYLYKTHAPRKIINDSLAYDRNVILDGDSYYDKSSLDGYILRNVMKKDPFVMRPTDSVLSSIVEMSRQKLGCIPIVNKERSVVGILTSQEIVKFIAYVLSE
jgi:predicted transcriptional regulator